MKGQASSPPPPPPLQTPCRINTKTKRKNQGVPTARSERRANACIDEITPPFPARLASDECLEPILRRTMLCVAARAPLFKIMAGNAAALIKHHIEAQKAFSTCSATIEATRVELSPGDRRRPA